MLNLITADEPTAINTSTLIPKLNHISSGTLSLKIAESKEEVIAAQRLRYEVFYKEMGARPLGDMAQTERENLAYDDHCVHLLVMDTTANMVVGTYRITTDEKVKQANVSLYTATEFDIDKLYATGGRIMEISRSCILAPYRNKATINLLWKGIAAFVYGNHIDYLIGTPSFEGTDIQAIQKSLAYLNAYHMADESIRPRALEPHYVPFPQIDKTLIDAKDAFMNLPPLLKGYLRVGAVIGDGAYIDEQFNCIDISMIMPIASVDDRYFTHYNKPADAS